MASIDNYLAEALDAYPCDLAKTLESLNYALSYNPECPHALCLMGRIHTEVLNDFEQAKSYYEQALQADLKAVSVYPHYISVLLANEDYVAAEKLIQFALTVKGVDKGQILYLQVLHEEYQGNLKEALTKIKEARKFGFNNAFLNLMSAEKTRIKSKMTKPKVKKEKKKNKSKKKVKNNK